MTAISLVLSHRNKISIVRCMLNWDTFKKYNCITFELDEWSLSGSSRNILIGLRPAGLGQNHHVIRFSYVLILIVSVRLLVSTNYQFTATI